MAFVGPRHQPERSYKIGSVHMAFSSSFCLPFHLSFCLSLSFLRLAHKFFLKLSMVLGAHIYILCVTVTFFGKNPHWPKMTKNDPKTVFGLFKKIILFLTGICVKWKFLWFINILQKLNAWEKPGSQVIAKNSSLPMRFQYSLIFNTSLID